VLSPGFVSTGFFSFHFFIDFCTWTCSSDNLLEFSNDGDSQLETAGEKHKQWDSFKLNVYKKFWNVFFLCLHKRETFTCECVPGMHENFYDPLLLLLCQNCIISSLMLSLMKSNLFVNKSEKYTRFFLQISSIHLGIFCQVKHISWQFALWMETNMPCDWLKPIGLRENLVVNYSSYCAW